MKKLSKEEKRSLLIIPFIIFIIIILVKGSNQVIEEFPFYEIRKDGIYVNLACFDCWWDRYEKIEIADASTFEYLGGKYARDKNNMYYWGDVIEEADLKTFKLIQAGDNGYASDKNNVYYDGYVIKEADSETFKLVQEDSPAWFATDKEHIFQGRKILPGDPKTLEFLLQTEKYDYYKVDEGVFFNSEKINNADIDSFEVLAPPYSRDKNNVYCGLRKIIDADSNSITTFSSVGSIDGQPVTVYAKDDAFAYFCSDYYGQKIIKIEEVDIKSFTAEGMEKGSAKDKYRTYFFHGISGNKENSKYKFVEY